MLVYEKYSLPWFLEKEIGRPLEGAEILRLLKAIPILKLRKPKTLVEMAKMARWVCNRPDCYPPGFLEEMRLCNLF